MSIYVCICQSTLCAIRIHSVMCNLMNVILQQLGLDSSRSRREKTTDGGETKIKSSKGNSKFVSPRNRKRQKVTVEAPQPKRRKLEDTRVGKMVDGVHERLHVQPEESTETTFITGKDARCVYAICTLLFMQ